MPGAFCIYIVLVSEHVYLLNRSLEGKLMLPSILQDVKWFSQGEARIAAVTYPEMELIAMDFSPFSLKKSLWS